MLKNRDFQISRDRWNLRFENAQKTAEIFVVDGKSGWKNRQIRRRKSQFSTWKIDTFPWGNLTNSGIYREERQECENRGDPGFLDSLGEEKI